MRSPANDPYIVFKFSRAHQVFCTSILNTFVSHHYCVYSPLYAFKFHSSFLILFLLSSHLVPLPNLLPIYFRPPCSRTTLPLSFPSLPPLRATPSLHNVLLALFPFPISFLHFRTHFLLRRPSFSLTKLHLSALSLSLSRFAHCFAILVSRLPFPFPPAPQSGMSNDSSSCPLSPVYPFLGSPSTTLFLLRRCRRQRVARRAEAFRRPSSLKYGRWKYRHMKSDSRSRTRATIWTAVRPEAEQKSLIEQNRDTNDMRRRSISL